MTETENEDVSVFLPARMLNEFTYCPRLFYLEWVQGEFSKSDDTLVGERIHARVDEEKGEMKDADELTEEDEFQAKSVTLSSERVGLIAKIDIIEGKDGQIIPIDYKKGIAPDLPEGAWEPERVQLCAQALVLRDSGYSCNRGIIYYAGSKKRVEIQMTDDLVSRTLDLLAKAREVANSGQIPKPLVDSNKCPRCSLVGICLPDEVDALASKGTVDLETGDVRRLFPARDDALPIYVQEQGAIVSKKGEEIEIRSGSAPASRAKLMEISLLALFGNVQITTPTIKELCDRGIPICYFSYGGWFYGVTHGMSHKNVELRQYQFAAASDANKSATIARQFVAGKIRNCRTLLRRNCSETPDAALVELARLAEVAEKQSALDTLFGVEGAAGRVYFAHFGEMLKADASAVGFDFQSRNRRPPKDPVNALLSFVYALLAKTTTVTLLAVGFDPYLGFFHQPRYGRPSLALDMMEEFRPLIADSVVIGLINNQEITGDDFIRRAGAVAIAPDARKKVIRAYERRLDALITHPVFGYVISYRRVLEVQARLLGRYLSGEIREYPVFLTR